MYLDAYDAYAKIRSDQLMREAANERLAALATAPSRSLRMRIANQLYTIAEWIEGQPSRPAIQLRA